MRPEVAATNDDDCDTTSEQLLSSWQELGVGHREIKSHRAPRRWRGAHIAAGVTAIIAGVTLTSGAFAGSRREDQSTTNIAQRVNDAPDHGNPLGIPQEAITQTTPSPIATESLRRAARANAASRSARPRGADTPPRWVTPVSKIDITSCYGWRNGRMHMGIDFSAPTGTPIRAVGAGRVVQAGWQYNGLGYSVVIDHGGGQMTLYGHASRVLVRTNQRVSAGSVIALVGSTGASTGPHLHLGYAPTRDLDALFSRLTNPAPWLRSHDVVPGRCR